MAKHAGQRPQCHCGAAVPWKDFAWGAGPRARPGPSPLSSVHSSRSTLTSEHVELVQVGQHACEECVRHMATARPHRPHCRWDSTGAGGGQVGPGCGRPAGCALRPGWADLAASLRRSCRLRAGPGCAARSSRAGPSARCCDSLCRQTAVGECARSVPGQSAVNVLTQRAEALERLLASANRPRPPARGRAHPRGGERPRRGGLGLSSRPSERAGAGALHVTVYVPAPRIPVGAGPAGP